jgi:hypothetical protein
VACPASYLVVRVAPAALVGSLLVLALLGCGLFQLVWVRRCRQLGSVALLGIS